MRICYDLLKNHGDSFKNEHFTWGQNLLGVGPVAPAPGWIPQKGASAYGQEGLDGGPLVGDDGWLQHVSSRIHLNSLETHAEFLFIDSRLGMNIPI